MYKVYHKPDFFGLDELAGNLVGIKVVRVQQVTISHKPDFFGLDERAGNLVGIKVVRVRQARERQLAGGFDHRGIAASRSPIGQISHFRRRQMA